MTDKYEPIRKLDEEMNKGKRIPMMSIGEYMKPLRFIEFCPVEWEINGKNYVVRRETSRGYPVVKRETTRPYYIMEGKKYWLR